MHQFKELKVWQKGRVLVKEIYKATHSFPKDELFGILCFDLEFFSQNEFEKFDAKLNEIQKMIFGLKHSLKNSNS